MRILFAIMLALPAPATASWTAANPEVTEAARDRDIAAVLAETVKMDSALIADDHAAFASRLAGDLAVNNPGNRISRGKDTAAMQVAGRISYSRYERSIEYAGLRGGMVVLMGSEAVTPKGGPDAGRNVVRRFTDIWRRDSGKWRLTARQATIISR